jgi:hypothetical protein
MLTARFLDAVQIFNRYFLPLALLGTLARQAPDPVPGALAGLCLSGLCLIACMDMLGLGGRWARFVNDRGQGGVTLWLAGLWPAAHGEDGTSTFRRPGAWGLSLGVLCVLMLR